MIVSNVAVVPAVPVAVEFGGTPGSPQTVLIVNGGPDPVFIVNKDATTKADPSISLASGVSYTQDGFGGERIWFLCDTAKSATLTVLKSEVN